MEFASPSVTQFFKNTFASIFTYFYAIGVLFIVVVSQDAPIDRAMCYFRFVGTVFSILTIGCFCAIIAFMAENKMESEEKKWVINGNIAQWEGTGTIRLSKMTLAGTVMLCVYILPMILRPKDALSHFKGYFVGLITYLFLLPIFVNIM